MKESAGSKSESFIKSEGMTMQINWPWANHPQFIWVCGWAETPEMEKSMQIAM